jgi:uncharacterized membrane protein
MDYASSAVIGAVAGLRSMTGPAIVSQAAGFNVIDVSGSPFFWLSSGRVGQISALLAAGELIADKLPFMPPRTDTPSLAIRFIAGAVCGAAVVSKRRRQDRIAGALIGGAAAVAASYIGFQYRKRARLSKLTAAMIEDAVAVSAGTAAVCAS